MEENVQERIVKLTHLLNQNKLSDEGKKEAAKLAKQLNLETGLLNEDPWYKKRMAELNIPL